MLNFLSMVPVAKTGKILTASVRQDNTTLRFYFFGFNWVSYFCFNLANCTGKRNGLYPIGKCKTTYYACQDELFEDKVQTSQTL